MTLNAKACRYARMSVHLLQEIEEFLVEFEIGDFRFGLLAAHNGRLVERLRDGGEILPRTERKVREYMAQRREAKRQGIGKPEPRSKPERAEAAA